MRQGAYILEIHKPDNKHEMIFPNYTPIKEINHHNKGDNYYNTEEIDRIHIELLFDLDILFSMPSIGQHIKNRSDLTDEEVSSFYKSLHDSFVIFYHKQFSETLYKNLYKITWID
jgi:hypothetical protein